MLLQKALPPCKLQPPSVLHTSHLAELQDTGSAREHRPRSPMTQVPKKLEALIQGKARFHPRLILSLSFRKRSSSPLAVALAPALPLSTELTAASAPLQRDIVQRLGKGEGSTQRRVEEGEGTRREEVQAGRVQESR